MGRRFLIACGLVAAWVPLFGQSGASLSADARQSYAGAKKNILNAVNKMPEDAFGFKPTPEIRSFAQVAGHIIEAQMRMCSAVLGESKSSDSSAKTAKADISAALKASFDECDKAFDALTDTNVSEAITTPRGSRSRLGALMGVIAHDEEQWGIMTVYMRLKGIAPTGP